VLTDTRIIQRHGSTEVFAQRHEILWPDGSAVCLHPVSLNGYPIDTWLRALQHAPGHWAVVDLRDVAPALASELPLLPRRDAYGLVFHTLRLQYPNARAFTAAAVGQQRMAWFDYQAVPA
jgi:hypothetical protein